MPDKLNNLSHLKRRRKELRNNSTPAEASLWNYLKGRQLDGHKFRRQHSFGEFILDFYCPEKRLVVELDGHYHKLPEQAEHDQRRTNFLEGHGLKVIRVENQNVFSHPQIVLDLIRQHLNVGVAAQENLHE